MPRAQAGFSVALPDLEDVFRVMPDSALDPAELRERRRERAERIADSPTPEIVQGITDILTRIDDIQDALVTLSVASRFAAPLIPALAPAAKAVATAADLLNVADIFSRLGLLGGSYKGTLYRQLAATPNTYSARLKRTLRTGRASPTFGELLQILQTADELLGVGLQLGPIMGARTDLAFLGLRGGTLEIPTTTLLEWASLAPTFFAANPWIRLAGLAGGFALSALDLPEGHTISIPIPGLLPIAESFFTSTTTTQPYLPTTQLLGAAEDVLTDAALLDLLEQDLSTADHAAVTLARYAALNVLAPFAFADNAGILRPERMALTIRAKFPSGDAPRHDRTAYAPGIPFTAALAIPGNPGEISWADYADTMGHTETPNALGWLRADPSSPLARTIAALTRDATATLALMLEGPAAITPWEWTPDALLAARAVETGRFLT